MMVMMGRPDNESELLQVHTACDNHLTSAGLKDLVFPHLLLPDYRNQPQYSLFRDVERRKGEEVFHFLLLDSLDIL